jgi:hypothetical protein
MGQTALLPLRRKEVVLRILIGIRNLSSSVGLEPANLELNGKHADHFTTEGDFKN